MCLQERKKYILRHTVATIKPIVLLPKRILHILNGLKSLKSRDVFI